MLRALSSRSEPVELAPPWHTAALVGLIVAVSLAGLVLTHGRGGQPGWPGSGSRPDGHDAYLPVVAVQIAMAIYVCRVGRTSNALFALLGRGWQTTGRLLGDLCTALLLWVSIEGIELTSALIARPAGSALLPHALLERVAWVAVAVTVGLSEELVYRGYLQTQLSAFTGHANVATIVQALLFGVAHLDQGPSAAARIGLYGLAFGVAARVRGSLWPGIVCHVGTDVLSGLLPV